MTTRCYDRYGALIGNTPMIDLSHLLETRTDVTILAKCEFMSPGFSVKDRLVAFILDRAEATGRLLPGGRVVAASSGNTGASLAMLAAIRGYRATIIVSPKCSQEKRDAIRAYGAQLIEAQPNQDYMAMAREMAAQDSDVLDIDQYDNPLNPEAHFHGLGEEIWQQTEGRITHFTCGGSTGGTITGVAKRLKTSNPEVSVVMADPAGSVFYDYFHHGTLEEVKPFAIEGVGKGCLPGALDLGVVDDVFCISDVEAFETCRFLAEKEGLMVGGSSGLNVFAALKLGQTVKAGSMIVTLLPDSGLKYLSKIFNDAWLDSQASIGSSSAKLKT